MQLNLLTEARKIDPDKTNKLELQYRRGIITFKEFSAAIRTIINSNVIVCECWCGCRKRETGADLEGTLYCGDCSGGYHRPPKKTYRYN